MDHGPAHHRGCPQVQLSHTGTAAHPTVTDTRCSQDAGTQHCHVTVGLCRRSVSLELCHTTVDLRNALAVSGVLWKPNCLTLLTVNVNSLPTLVRYVPLIRLRHKALYRLVSIGWLIDLLTLSVMNSVQLIILKARVSRQCQLHLIAIILNIGHYMQPQIWYKIPT